MDSFYEHLTTFAGKPVVDWEPDIALEDASSMAYRISISWEDSEAEHLWTDKFASFLSDEGSREVEALIVGPWENVGVETTSERMIEALVTAHEKLPNLKALFLGEIISEESEISWIVQSDISPLFQAYPELEELWVRGGNALSLGVPLHQHLKKLVIQSGALDGSISRQVGQAVLPQLEHLELWLGTENYGGTTTVEDLQPILSGQNFPKLTYLGLRDSEIADEIAPLVAKAPILARLTTLDLSLGTLSDTGAEALINSPQIGKLQKLDIHHHYCTPEVVKRLEQLPLEVDTTEMQDPSKYGDDEYRYVAVSE